MTNGRMTPNDQNSMRIRLMMQMILSKIAMSTMIFDKISQ
jgi:hypothetical protein